MIEDLKHGRCASCGSQEIYQAEISASADANLRIRKPGGRGKSRHVDFEAFVCAWCGFVQWHLKLDQYARHWLQTQLPRVPPPPAQPPVPPQPPQPPQPPM